MDILNKLSFKLLWEYLKKPNPIFSIFLTILIFIFICNNDLIGNFQIQFLLEKNNLSLLSNFLMFGIHFYYLVIKYIFFLISGLLFLTLLLEELNRLNRFDKLDSFYNKYCRNMVSAIVKLIRIGWQLTNGTFLILSLVTILFFGKTFLMTIFDLNFEMVRLNYLTVTEFLIFHASLLLNLGFSIGYTVYHLFRCDENLPF